MDYLHVQGDNPWYIYHIYSRRSLTQFHQTGPDKKEDIISLFINHALKIYMSLSEGAKYLRQIWQMTLQCRSTLIIKTFLQNLSQFSENLLFTYFVSSVDKLCKQFGPRSGPNVIKLFPCSTQLSSKFILRINVKMPTIN